MRSATLLRAAAAWGALVFCGPALAETPPRYDVQAYCNDVSEVSGGSSMILNGCMDMEQQAYNQLKAAWPGISSKIRNYCNEVAQVSGGSYSILEGCIDMEQQQSAAPRKFEY